MFKFCCKNSTSNNSDASKASAFSSALNKIVFSLVIAVVAVTFFVVRLIDIIKYHVIVLTNNNTESKTQPLKN